MKYDPKKYLAYKLTDACQTAILKEIKPLYDNVVAEHVTIFFNGSAAKFEVINDNLTSSPLVYAYAELSGDGVQCLLISIDGELRRETDNKHYHLTYSLEDGVKAVASNALITSSLPIKPSKFLKEKILLSGSFEMLDK